MTRAAPAFFHLRKREHMMMLSIDYGLCEGCGACAEMYPRFFEIRDEKAWIINYEASNVEEYRKNPVICPYRAIILE